MKEKRQNCWEYMACPKKIRQNCDAYMLDFGEECWMIIKDVSEGCSAFFGPCIECPWYKNKNLKVS